MVDEFKQFLVFLTVMISEMVCFINNHCVKLPLRHFPFICEFLPSKVRMLLVNKILNPIPLNLLNLSFSSGSQTALCADFGVREAHFSPS